MENVIVEKPTVPAYPGMRWIYHRLTRAVEYMHDSKILVFVGGEYKQLPEQVAVWLFEYHAKREHPERYDDPDPAIRLEAVEYAFALDDDPHYGVPLLLSADDEREYLSRDGQAMYLQRGSDVKTHPQFIRVGEVPASGTVPPVQATGPDPTVALLLAQISELKAKLDEKPIRGRRRPRSRMVHKAQGSEPNPRAEAPATA